MGAYPKIAPAMQEGPDHARQFVIGNAVRVMRIATGESEEDSNQEHLFMAQTGIEADLASLRARVSQIEQEREIKKKERAKLGLISLWIAIGFMVYGIALGSIDLLHGHSPGPMAWAPM
jgi:hypothetical protein